MVQRKVQKMKTKRRSVVSVVDTVEKVPLAEVLEQATPPSESPVHEPRPLPQSLLQQVLSAPPPHPMVVLPAAGGYWLDDGQQRSSPTHRSAAAAAGVKLEVDAAATCYRTHFLGKEHFNYVSVDATQAPVVLSMKYETIGGSEHVRVIVRQRAGTVHDVLPAPCFGDNPSPAAVTKSLCEDVSAERFQPVLYPKASELLVKYDEHVLTSAFKFGVIYQKHGQTCEEALFGNTGHSAACERFLALLGERVRLRDFAGFRGGLDTQHGQTGDTSVYRRYGADKEIMFHVCTLLPHNDKDAQQLQRKRHIGNDIVAVVFQDPDATFTPDMIASHFLHTYVVVQPLSEDGDNTQYKVCVASRDDVPRFGPPLPESGTFEHGEDFLHFLLTTLLNAEHACYRAPRFSRLQERTRAALLDALCADLRARTLEAVSQLAPTPLAPMTPGDTKTVTAGGGGGETNKIFSTFRRAISGKTKTTSSSSSGGSKSKGLRRNYSEGSTLTRNEGTSQAENGNSGKISGDQSDCVSVGSLTQSSYRTCSPTHSPTHSPTQPVNKPNILDLSRSSSCSSFNSVGGGEDTALDLNPGHGDDSDTGMESMSSAETPSASHAKRHLSSLSSHSFCEDQGYQGGGGVPGHDHELSEQVDCLRQEVNKLKMEKLELLKQQVAAQKEVRRLRERDSRLTADLALAQRQVSKLKVILSSPAEEVNV